jgi:hypothetical protein
LAWRLITNRWPCRRSTFNDPNSVSLQALTQANETNLRATYPHSE